MKPRTKRAARRPPQSFNFRFALDEARDLLAAADRDASFGRRPFAGKGGLLDRLRAALDGATTGER